MALRPQFVEVSKVIDTMQPARAIEAIQAFEKETAEVSGASKVKSALAKARRALKNKEPDVEKAKEELAKAIALYEGQTGWREAAKGEITEGLASYERVLRDTVGMRQQQKMSREQALSVAACQSDHRDISLNF